MLALLYNQRQTSPEHPGVSLLDLEREMGFPREYLTFTMWYLNSKGLVNVADNSDYTITAAGADYVERKAARNAIVGRLLNPGGARFPAPSETPQSRSSPTDQSRRYLLPTSLKVRNAD